MPNDHYDLLNHLAPVDVERTLVLGSRISLSSGGELFPLGAAADSLYLISRGQISLTLPMKVRDRDGPSVIASTLCMVHNRFGRYYLSCITPFHKFGLRKLMASTPCRDGEFAKSSLDLRRYGNVAVYVGGTCPFYTAKLHDLPGGRRANQFDFCRAG